MEYPDKDLDTLCGLFGRTKQAWYQKKRYTFKELVDDDILLQMVYDIRENCPGVGARKLKVMLCNQYFLGIGRDKLLSFLRKYGLLLRTKTKNPRTTFSGHVMPVYPNLVGGMIPTRPNQVWVSDITYVRVEDGFVYLFLITDMYSRKIVGWELAEDMKTDHAITALRMAIKQKSDPSLPTIHHSDRGSQYCCADYVRLLKKNHIEISMTENGDPKENAYAERINGIIKNEFIRKWLPTRKTAKELARIGIENYNN